MAPHFQCRVLSVALESPAELTAGLVGSKPVFLWPIVLAEFSMAYVRKSAPRGPRPEELEFLRSLALGPRAVSRGPVGRCLKRGWCERVEAHEIDPSSQDPIGAGMVVSLTEAGRALLRTAEVTRSPV